MMKIFLFITIIIVECLYSQDAWDYSIPGMSYLHRKTNKPLDIHILLVDLKSPELQVKTVLSNNYAWGREKVSGMAGRTKAQAAINGDFFSADNGIPQGLTVTGNELVLAPKFRTAIGFAENKAAKMGMWTDRWNWYGSFKDSEGNEHELKMMNIDFNENWMVLYTDLYGHRTPGKIASWKEVEVVVGPDSLVKEVRWNQQGIIIQKNDFVIAGRESAADWLLQNIEVGERIYLNLATIPDWSDLQEAISGGPRIVKDGEYYADPIAEFPNGEEFTLSYKTTYYNTNQPRSAAGLTINRDTLIFCVVDGRQANHSVGVTLQQLANLLIEFGAWEGMQFDSGGSATFYFNGAVRNNPSDGTERSVANSMCVYNSMQFKNLAPQSEIIGVSGEISGYEADFLIDGNKSRTSGKWAADEDSLHWIEIDLGELKSVTHFQLFNAFYSGDEDYLNTKEFKIYTKSDSSGNWTEDFHVINDSLMARDNLCSYDSSRSVRYVRLEIIQANHLDYENVLRQPEFAIYELDYVVSVDNEISGIPNGYSLNQNYPNPFNPETIISFSLPFKQQVEIEIYNILGEKVGKLVNKMFEAGLHEVSFNASQISSGVYFYRMKAGDFVSVNKMMVIK